MVNYSNYSNKRRMGGELINAAVLIRVNTEQSGIIMELNPALK